MKGELVLLIEGFIFQSRELLSESGFGIALGVGIAGQLQANVQRQFFQEIVHMLF